jgi:hypothetical protein
VLRYAYNTQIEIGSSREATKGQIHLCLPKRYKNVDALPEEARTTRVQQTLVGIFFRDLFPMRR